MYIWSSSHVLAELLNSLECPNKNHKGFFSYVNEVTKGWEACLPVESITWLDGWNFQFHFPTSGERGQKLNQSPVASGLISHAYIMKSSQKPQRTGSQSFWFGEHMGVLRKGMKVLSHFPIPGPVHFSHLTFPDCTFL